MTPTQRTLKKLKEDGYQAGIVERFAPPVKGRPHGIRIDLFNIIDIIAIKPLKREWSERHQTFVAEGGHILGVQSTGQDFAGHRQKLTVEKAEQTRAWLEAGGKLELWGWRKLKVKRGGKAMRWTPRIEQITIFDLEGK